MQDGTRVGKSLPPPLCHLRTAKRIILRAALGFDWAVDKLHDIHFGNTTKLIEPLGLFRGQELRRQQFVELIDGMPHVVPFAKSVRTDFRPAGIADILVAFGNLIEIGRQQSLRLE
jgi:hypothetical protein